MKLKDDKKHKKKKNKEEKWILVINDIKLNIDLILILIYYNYLILF